MAEYIDREAVVKLREEFWKDRCDYMAVRVTNIMNIPAADVVEIVRCKDCDVPHNRWLGCRNLNGLIPPPDFYCAKGKRKMNGKGDDGGR